MMKHRSLLFIGLITAGLSLSSCNFADILADKLKLIEISQESIPNYVVGESNRLAFILAINVAQSPGTIRNPLFIYGNSGL